MLLLYILRMLKWQPEFPEKYRFEIKRGLGFQTKIPPQFFIRNTQTI